MGKIAEQQIDERTQWAKSLQQQVDERTQWALSLDQELVLVRSNELTLRAEVISAQEHIAQLTYSNDQLNQHLQETETQLHSAQQQLEMRISSIKNLEYQLLDVKSDYARVINSRSWKLTKPLRFIGRLLRGETDLVALAVKPRLQRLARSVYHRLPFNSAIKNILAAGVYRVSGSMFEGVVHYEMWRRSGKPNLPAIAMQGVIASDDIQATLNTLVLPVSATPLVSVIIPSYGNLPIT